MAGQHRAADGLVKVDHDLTCSSFERLTTYMTKARARIRRWRQSQGLQKPKTPRPNDTRWSRKRFDEAFALPDDREYWEKKIHPGYTLRECEQHITGNNTKHLIVKLKNEAGHTAEEQEEPAMSARLELDDLPPRYRAQAEAQIAARQRGKVYPYAANGGGRKRCWAVDKTFDSYGEYVYYIGTILPGIQSGKIVSAEPHPKWTLLQEEEYCAVKLPAAHYTADYKLTYADGRVDVVEIKSKFTRKAQRDYIYRRRLFHRPHSQTARMGIC